MGGTGKDGRKEEIGEGRLKVTVPHRARKVVLVLPREGGEPRKDTRVIAVVMPNDQTVDYDWAKYRVTTRQGVPATFSTAVRCRLASSPLARTHSTGWPGKGGKLSLSMVRCWLFVAHFSSPGITHP